MQAEECIEETTQPAPPPPRQPCYVQAYPLPQPRPTRPHPPEMRHRPRPVPPGRRKRQDSPRLPRHTPRHGRRPEQRILVRNNGGHTKHPRRRPARRPAQVVVPRHGGADLVRVGRRDGVLDAAEGVALDYDARAHARVDGRRHVLVVAVVDVGGAEADRGRARADVAKVVVRVGDAEVGEVLGGVGVGVPDEGGFPVVVEEGAGWEGGLAGVGRRKWGEGEE